MGHHPDFDLKEGFEIWAQGLPYPGIVCDPVGKIIDMNQAFVDLMGQTREEMELQRIFWYLPEERKEEIDASLKHLLETRHLITSLRMGRPRRLMEVTVVPIEREGELVGQYWLFIVKEEGREKEEQLTFVQEDKSMSKETPKVGTWTYDFEEEEFFASQDTYQIFGRTPEAFDGSLENVVAFLKPEDRSPFVEAMKKSYEGVPLNIDFGIITSYGREKMIRAKAEMFYQKDRTPDKMIGTVQDLTENLLIEKNFNLLREHLMREERFITGGSYRVNVEKGTVEVGEEVRSIFGLDPEKKTFERTVLHDRVHPEDREHLIGAQRIASAKDTFDIEYRIVQSDQQIRMIHSRGEGEFVDGELVAIVGVIEDITQMHRLRDEIDRTYRDLQEAQQTFRMGSWSMDLTTQEITWSEATFRIYGMDPEEGEPNFEQFLENLHPDDRAYVQETMGQPPMISPFEMAFRIKRPDGEVRYIKHLVDVIYRGKTPVAIRGNIQDVTEQKELEERVKKSQEEMEGIQKRYQILLENAKDIFEIIDEEGKVMYISPTVKKMMGYQDADILGHYIWEFVEGEEKGHLKQLVELSRENPRKILEAPVEAHTKEGRHVFLQVTMSNHLSDPEVQGIILNWKDVTAESTLQRELQYLADYDEMTDLPNRSYFQRKTTETIEQSGQKGDRFGVYMIDIDGFKDVSDALGMGVGDALIKKVGKVIKERFQNEEAFLARYYGDQFGLLLGCTETLMTCRLATEQILSIFHEPFHIDQYELNITASVGFSVYPDDGEEAIELIKNSNTALNRAKKEGKSRYQAYSSRMDVKSFKEFSLRNDLKRAIEENQLVIYFQPILKLNTGEILGVEALTRWEHPEWGLVKPEEFIPIAENTGMIIPMGQWILDRVCRYYREWLDKGLPLVKMAVNYSGVQFFQKNFVEYIVNTLADYKIDPRQFIFEITESVLLDQGQQTENNLKVLRSLGIQIAIDDFGTGYSSFSYLHTMDVDILKIDHEFLHDVPDDESRKKILKAIIGLAKDLKMKIVAEGVENWDQLLYLRRLNCLVGQGNLYQRAIPAEAIEPVLARRRIRPQRANDASDQPEKERRKSFRVEFLSLLEADMTILEINGKKTNVGNTKCLIRNIGPGGLCFLTNVNFPLKRDLILQFGTELMGQVLRVHGTPVWREELELGIVTYGLEFNIDENARMKLTGLLNQVHIRVKNDVGFNDGRFIATSIRTFFHKEAPRMERDGELEL